MARKDDKIEELIKSGEAKITEGDFEGAIKDHDKAINLNPADKSQLAEVYNDRGFAKNELGRYEEGIEDCTKAIDLKPADKKLLSSAYNNRGLAKNNLDYHKEAVTDYDEAIRLDPKNVIAWSNRGLAKDDLGHHEEAIADYDEAIRLDPKNAFARSNRGTAKAHLEDFDGAIRDVEEARRISPENPKILNNRAAIMAEKAARDAVEERVGSLKISTEEAEKQARKYKWKERINRFVAYLLMIVLIGTIAFLIVVLIVPNLPSEHLSKLLSEYFPELLPEYSSELPPECSPKLKPECPSELKPIDVKILFNLLPLISIIIIITSPLVWLIRLLITVANKAELMRAEYGHLAYVEKKIFFHFAKDDTKEGKEIRADYIKATMTNSPADKLLVFQSKANVPSPSSVQNVAETIGSKINNKKTR